MTLKQKLTMVVLAVSAALPLTLTAPLAQSQTQGANNNSYSSANARVDSFEVRQLDRVKPGDELVFTLAGTPGAEVTVQIVGADKPLRLNEERPGRYEGAYTVRSRDRVTAASLVTARLAHNGQVATASLDRSLVAGERSPAGAATASIAAFDVVAPDRPRPGDDLKFSMTGAPGGSARAMVKGVANRIPLTETSRGVYEGNYTVRRQDKLNGALAATGYLMVDRQESSQRFERQFAGNGEAARRTVSGDYQKVQTCANCGVIQSVDRVKVEGDSSNAIGTIAGGVLGGVLGNQVGGGNGKKLATVAGAIGGAYAGNRVQNRMDDSTQYRVVVRLDGGGTRTFTYPDDPAVTVGTRVKIDNDVLIRR